MELDKRIKNNHRPLSVIDIKWANGFVGKNGFFADAMNCFENLSECQSGLLISVKDKKLHPFECDNQWTYTFFIPEEWVKEPENKYRPYTLAEWVDQHEIGEVIRFRNTCNQEFNVMYLGYILDTNDDIQDIRTKGQIMFVSTPYTLQELFERYEICINGEWQPFGVIDESR